VKCFLLHFCFLRIKNFKSKLFLKDENGFPAHMHTLSLSLSLSVFFLSLCLSSLFLSVSLISENNHKKVYFHEIVLPVFGGLYVHFNLNFLDGNLFGSSILFAENAWKSQVWWYTPVISALKERGRRIVSWGQSGLHTEFKVSPGYIARPCLRNKMCEK
jgi:hypothetical protein